VNWGDLYAAEYRRAAAAARSRLPRSLQGRVAPEDCVQDAAASVVGQPPQPGLLVVAAWRRAAEAYRASRAPKRDVRREAAPREAASTEDDAPELAGRSPAPGAALEAAESLTAAIRSEPRAAYRVGLWLVAEGWSCDEVAAVLGCSGRSVERALARARAILRREEEGS
jgi:DNA-directed RNA polymerase specialized sigma24 family protein